MAYKYDRRSVRKSEVSDGTEACPYLCVVIKSVIFFWPEMSSNYSTFATCEEYTIFLIDFDAVNELAISIWKQLLGY